MLLIIPVSLPPGSVTLIERISHVLTTNVAATAVGTMTFDYPPVLPGYAGATLPLDSGVAIRGCSGTYSTTNTSPPQ